MIHKVKAFNDKFGLPDGSKDLLSKDQELQNFRVNFLYEELRELQDAFAESNRVEAFDALLDLVYVAQGTALMMGVSVEQWSAGMIAVHRANMSKVKVESALDSKRGSALDLKKPTGWVGPEADLERILSW